MKRLASQKRLARAIIRGNLRWAARERRRVAHLTYATAAFHAGYAASSISMAKCCELINEKQADRYEARLKQVARARITRLAS